ncbi:uracil-DNA glycosylase-like [Oratosquilla oratoria]|uniref:uracil-DNA glycosylase-like n=1 Tax=Oratosquilla oratoria TaxID=337810 RepID=UPI003F75890D
MVQTLGYFTSFLKEIPHLVIHPRTMASSQKTLLNYFSRVNKRKSEEQQTQVIPKKTALDNSKENINANTEDSFSPDQSKRMEMNKIMAEIKLQSRKTPALHSSIGISWYKALKEEFSKPYFMELSEFLVTERQRNTIFPPEDQVFSWTNYCELNEVKVVVLGQDPYHGPRQAHGLCFSVQKGVKPPPSLLNMYKELNEDIPGFEKPNHGLLVGWARQGVLLLNACLTVKAHNANSHKDKGWERLTDAVIKVISEQNRGVVFLLWGSYAQKKASVVDKKKHHLLNATHPSPLSAHRGFLGCKHFSKCNELLVKQGKKPIDWNRLPLEM